jgi:membrane protease YdiL (CAAX protease family)
MVRFVEHVPLRVFGMGFHEDWKKDLMLGLFVSGAMLAVMLAGSEAFGQLTVRWTAYETPIPTLLFTLLILAIAAANEEIVFRGYPMQLILRNVGAVPAVVSMSVLFGLLHVFNPNATPLGTINTILAGVALSIGYLKTRSLWLPYGIHVGWNVGLGMILGYPLSGLDIGSLWTSETHGADIIVGGLYGPEGGVLATFIFSGAALYLALTRAARISPAMRDAVMSTEQIHDRKVSRTG